MRLLKRCAAAIPEVFELSWHDHTVVMSAEIWQVAQWLKGVLAEDKHPRRQALKAAEYLEHIFAIITHRHGLTVWPDVHKFLDYFPGFGINYNASTVVRLGIQNRNKHLAAIH